MPAVRLLTLMGIGLVCSLSVALGQVSKDQLVEELRRSSDRIRTFTGEIGITGSTYDYKTSSWSPLPDDAYSVPGTYQWQLSLPKLLLLKEVAEDQPGYGKFDRKLTMYWNGDRFFKWDQIDSNPGYDGAGTILESYGFPFSPTSFGFTSNVTSIAEILEKSSDVELKRDGALIIATCSLGKNSYSFKIDPSQSYLVLSTLVEQVKDNARTTILYEVTKTLNVGSTVFPSAGRYETIWYSAGMQIGGSRYQVKFSKVSDNTGHEGLRAVHFKPNVLFNEADTGKLFKVDASGEMQYWGSIRSQGSHTSWVTGLIYVASVAIVVLLTVGWLVSKRRSRKTA